MKISRRLLASSLHILGNAASLTDAATTWKVGQTVKTTSGSIVGHAASDASEVSEYLGIPYAQPPTGNLRFQPPAVYNGTGIIKATEFGNACMQPSLAMSSYRKHERRQFAGLNLAPAGIALLQSYARSIGNQDEDCLTVNVWTKPQTGDANKAVMVWVHGGGWTTGSSAISWYNGQYFADQEDVIVVSLNYRLNVFGFSGYPGAAQNIGLMDQRMAVEWVRDNIEAFGGDPTRITVFGESVGAMSVDIYSFAYTEDPIAAGLISESGVATSLPALTPDNASSQWNDVAQSLGCSGDDATVLTCMQNLTSKQILDATDTDSFGIIADDILVFSDYTNRTPAAVPYLVGHNDFEPGLKRALSTVIAATDVYTQQQEDIFQCPTAVRCQQGVSNNIPTWRYRYFGVFPNTILSNSPPSGAYHTSELTTVFGTMPSSVQAVTANTDAQNDISAYMRAAWATFAKDPANGLLSYDTGWPTYNANANTLIQLAYNNQTGTNLVAGNAFDSGCTGSSSSSSGNPTTPQLTYLMSIVVAAVVLASC